jgi:hypothetical protein
VVLVLPQLPPQTSLLKKYRLSALFLLLLLRVLMLWLL